MTDPHTAPDTAPAGRDARGRFQPGQSGNPAGKKPGTLNHATRLKLLLADEAYDVVAGRLIAAATDGHMPSVKFLMERLVPKPRWRAIALDLPPGASRRERLTALVDQMCAGEISPDEAKAMIAVIDVAAREADLHSAWKPEPAAAPQAPTPEAAPAGREAGGGVDGDAALHFACISRSAPPVGLRARLLQSTCISSSPSVMPGLDPGIMTGAAAAAARATVAMAGSSRSSPAMTETGCGRLAA
jgi:hypothetical protein